MISMKICILTIDIMYTRTETNTIFWYAKSHFPYQMNIQRLAYLSQLVSSKIIVLNLSITILLQVTTAHDDITTSVFIIYINKYSFQHYCIHIKLIIIITIILLSLLLFFFQRGLVKH